MVKELESIAENRRILALQIKDLEKVFFSMVKSNKFAVNVDRTYVFMI